MIFLRGSTFSASVTNLQAFHRCSVRQSLYRYNWLTIFPSRHVALLVKPCGIALLLAVGVRTNHARTSSTRIDGSKPRQSCIIQAIVRAEVCLTLWSHTFRSSFSTTRADSLPFSISLPQSPKFDADTILQDFIDFSTSAHCQHFFRFLHTVYDSNEVGGQFLARS